MHTQHFQMTIKHSYINMYFKPTVNTIVVDMHGKQTESISALKDTLARLKEDVAEDGTETYEQISITHVIEEGE